jgi:hypothetical protein
MYPAIRQAPRNWKPALRMFQIQWGEERVPPSALQ